MQFYPLRQWWVFADHITKKQKQKNQQQQQQQQQQKTGNKHKPNKQIFLSVPTGWL